MNDDTERSALTDAERERVTGLAERGWPRDDLTIAEKIELLDMRARITAR